MALIEKASIIFALTTAAGFSIYSALKPRISKSLNNQSIIEKRKEIIANKDVRVLYSSMSFLYLQAYHNEPKDLILFKDILDISVLIYFCFRKYLNIET